MERILDKKFTYLDIFATIIYIGNYVIYENLKYLNEKYYLKKAEPF